MASVSTTTKSRKPVYLLEKFTEEIRGQKLPSNRQALGHFLFLHLQQKKTVRESSTLTVDEIEQFWNRARIPVRHKQDSIKKIEVLFHQWRSLKKNASRRTDTQQRNEEQFTELFDDLFDIAHGEAMSMIKIDEDKEFLIAQREKGRRGGMSSVDTVLAKKETKQHQKLIKEQERRYKSASEQDSLQEQVSIDCSSSSSSDDDTDKDVSYHLASGVTSSELPPAAKRGRQTIMTPDLAAFLDRNKVSDRAAVMIVGETAKSLGQDISTLTLNRSSIQRQRQHCRAECAEKIQQSFQPGGVLVVHWDGKLLPDLSGQEMVDRLPILVSSTDGDVQLLAVPKIPAGTGSAQARAVFDALNEWGITSNVQGLCFDTTSSNTGRKNGACVLLQQLIGRDLLYLACRHHMLELVASAAFTQVMGSSSAPEVLLFKRFKAHWQFIDKSQFQDSSSDQESALVIASIKEALGTMLMSAVAENQPRDDYRELAEVTLIYLGITPQRGIHFRAPGAMHQARWMSKIIYTFKVWLFRSQFQLSTREETGLRQLCIFFATVYVKAWYTAPLASAAANNDLQLLKCLLKYSSTNSAISKVTSHKMMDHLWYLSENLVGLAFFDNAISNEIKDRMVQAMNEVDGAADPPKRIQLHQVSSADLERMSTADFVTKNTRSLFITLDLPQGFLHLPAEQWAQSEDYQAAAKRVHHLTVINDHAERGVALVEQFSGRLTKNEEQLQFLMQLVSDNRKRYPNALKRSLMDHQ